MTASEIVQVLEKARELGIKHLKVDGMEFTIDEPIGARAIPVETEVPDQTAEQLVAPTSPWDDLSEEEIKYWSTPHFDTLMAEKERAKNAKLNKEP